MKRQRGTKGRRSLFWRHWAPERQARASLIQAPASAVGSTWGYAHRAGLCWLAIVYAYDLKKKKRKVAACEDGGYTESGPDPRGNIRTDPTVL